MFKSKIAIGIILICVWLETSNSIAVNWPAFFPHLSLLVLIFTGMTQGPQTGIRFGLFVGLLMDLLSADPFGLYMALYMCIGFFCGLMKGKVFVEAFVAQWVVPAVCYAFILAIVTAVITTETFDYAVFLGLLIKQSSFIATLLSAPLVFYVCKTWLVKHKSVERYVFLK